MQHSRRELTAEVAEQPQATALILLRLLGRNEPGVVRQIPVAPKGLEDPVDVIPAVSASQLSAHTVQGS
jgi:hypothetical protein